MVRSRGAARRGIAVEGILFQRLLQRRKRAHPVAPASAAAPRATLTSSGRIGAVVARRRVDTTRPPGPGRFNRIERSREAHCECGAAARHRILSFERRGSREGRGAACRRVRDARPRRRGSRTPGVDRPLLGRLLQHRFRRLDVPTGAARGRRASSASLCRRCRRPLQSAQRLAQVHAVRCGCAFSSHTRPSAT